jgi:hypothetical protein
MNLAIGDAYAWRQPSIGGSVCALVNTLLWAESCASRPQSAVLGDPPDGRGGTTVLLRLGRPGKLAKAADAVRR